MDLCIKTHPLHWNLYNSCCFNPCFNGSMYKNKACFLREPDWILVSILVLMDLCIKTRWKSMSGYIDPRVSILVLMDLCIKTALHWKIILLKKCFNPCFNGSMYKNCFNWLQLLAMRKVSILVLMDLCIKTQDP